MKTLREQLKTNRLYFDGGTGTVLQGMGLPAGTPTEMWSLEHPEKITDLHRAYIEAGCNIIKTNTFGVNPAKYEDYDRYISAAIRCAKEAACGKENVYIALDI